MDKFRLLSKKETFGKKRLSVFQVIDKSCETTDFSHYLAPHEFRGKTKLGTFDDWWLSTRRFIPAYSENEKYYVSANGDVHGTIGMGVFEKWLINDIGIRPAMKYYSLDEINKNPKRNNDGILEVEYGEYPQESASEEISKKLEEQVYKLGKLKETGKKYTIYPLYFDSSNEEVPPKQVIEYEFNGKRYVKWRDRWFRVSPIKWYVDEKKNLLISKKILIGGIEYERIPNFLNTYFSREIIVENPKKEEDKRLDVKEKKEDIISSNEEVSSSERLINKIYKYLEGNPNKDAIAKKLAEMIEDYNAKLDDVRTKKLNNVVTMDTYESITNAFELKLEMLLMDVKKHHETFKDYFDMLAILDKYIALINGNKDEEYSDGFINDLDAIESICLPFLKEEDANLIGKQLIGVFNDEKREIVDYIDNKGKLSYHTIEEMALDLRKKIHPILMDLSTSVNKRDVEVEISTAVSKIIGGLFKQPENEALSFYLVEINNVYTIINDLIDKLPLDMKNEYKNEILDIMNMNIDYSKDFNDVASSLRAMWLSLNKVLFRLNNYLNEIDKLYVGRIDVNKFNK